MSKLTEIIRQQTESANSQKEIRTATICIETLKQTEKNQEKILATLTEMSKILNDPNSRSAQLLSAIGFTHSIDGH